MNIFISYSVEDLEVVKQIAGMIKARGDKVCYWDESMEPGEPKWPTISKWIEACDAVIVVITDRTVARAGAVGKECGIAESKGKKILPMVASNVDDTCLGFLGDRTWVRFEPAAPREAIKVITQQISKLARDKIIGNLLFAAGVIVVLCVCRE